MLMISVTLVTFTTVLIFKKRKSWEKKGKNFHTLVVLWNTFYISVFPISIQWDAVDLACFDLSSRKWPPAALCTSICAYMCLWVCTLLSSKLGDKGGVESLMSCLTGCIHVSLFFQANTCCSVWERHCDATHTNRRTKRSEKERVKVFCQTRDNMSGGHYSLVTFKRKISFQSQNIYGFWFDALHRVFQQ